MEFPKELELIKKLVGEWTVEVALKIPDHKILSGCGSLTAKMLGSNLGLSVQVDLQVEESEEYFEDGLWSFDRKGGKIHYFSLNSQGDVHDHVGCWTDNKNLVVKWTGRYEGKPASEEIRLKWVGSDEIRVFETETALEQPDVTLEYVLKRKNLT